MEAFIWLVLIILLASAFILVITRKIRPWWKKNLSLLLVLLGIGFVSFQLLFPFHEPLKTSGQLTVITETLYFKHETAFPDYATNESQREIPVKLWLPSQSENEQYPLIIFSHGSFGVAESNESLFLELASHGYAIASLDHPYHSFASTLSDGQTILVDSSFFQSVINSQGSEDLQGTLERFVDWQEIRVEDINFVLDSILQDEINQTYLERINPQAILLAGHSLGGSAALEVGRERADELIGVISLEAPFFGDIQGIEGDEYLFVTEEYPLPVLHFYSDALWGRLDEITTYEMNQRLINSQSAKFVNVHIAGSGHIGLTDLSLVTPTVTNLLDGGLNTKPPYEKLAEINQASLNFLENLEY